MTVDCADSRATIYGAVFKCEADRQGDQNGAEFPELWQRAKNECVCHNESLKKSQKM